METAIIRLKVGQTHVVQLKGKGTTGYQWIAFPKSKKIITVTKSFSSKEIKKEIIGASANEVFTITAMQKGNTTLVLKQIKPWEKKPVPLAEISHEIIVE